MGFFSFLTEPVSNLVGGLASGALGFLGASEAADEASDTNYARMDWEDRMSNTQYQRGVQDLRAAGLNPALAYLNNAKASYNSVSLENPKAGLGEQWRASAQAVIEGLKKTAEVDAIRQQISTAKSQERLNNAQTLVARENAGSVAADNALKLARLPYEQELAKKQVDYLNTAYGSALTDMRFIGQDIGATIGGIGNAAVGTIIGNGLTNVLAKRGSKAVHRPSRDSSAYSYDRNSFVVDRLNNTEYSSHRIKPMR